MSLSDADKKKYLNVQPDYVKLLQKHFTPGRGGKKIRYITRHHLAGVGTTDQVWDWWQTRKASAHYVIENSGRVGQLVWDRDTAWSNTDSASNAETITIEHSNSAGAAQDYPINDTVIREGARWAAALCLFYALGRPEFGVNIRDHRNFGATLCPHHLAEGGRYHDAWMHEAQTFYDVLVAAKTNNDTAPPPPTPDVEQKPPAAPPVIQSDLVSLINPAVRFNRAEDIALITDAATWRIERKLDALLSALGMDPDEITADAIAADIEATSGGRHAA